METGRLMRWVRVPLVALMATEVVPVITWTMAIDVLFALWESPP
jgi:hypothetical protein